MQSACLDLFMRYEIYWRDVYVISVEMAEKQRNKGILIFKHVYKIILKHLSSDTTNVKIFIEKFN